MPRPVPKKPHPKREAIISMLTAGHMVKDVVATLRCDKTAVQRIRRDLNLTPRPSESLEDRWKRHAVAAEDGHVRWTGDMNHGTPVIRYRNSDYSARAVAFTMRTGRRPQGQTMPHCGLHGCVAPDHMEDARERAEVRAQVRSLRGLPPPPETCSAGHDQKVHGGYDGVGNAYCQACNTRRKAKAKTRLRERG